MGCPDGLPMGMGCLDVAVPRPVARENALGKEVICCLNRRCRLTQNKGEGEERRADHNYSAGLSIRHLGFLFYRLFLSLAS